MYRSLRCECGSCDFEVMNIEMNWKEFVFRCRFCSKDHHLNYGYTYLTSNLRSRLIGLEWV